MKDRDDEYKQLIIDYKEAFGSEGGKRVRENLEQLAKFNSSFIPYDNQGKIDVLAVMRNEGQRSVIVHINRMIVKDPYEEKQKVAISKE